MIELNPDATSEQNTGEAESTGESEGATGLDDPTSCTAVKFGLAIGKGVTNALKFRARSSGPGAYTFESTDFPDYFLTVD